MRTALEEGVQYIETRKGVSSSYHVYVLDPAATETYGKRVIDENDGEMDITLAMEVYYNNMLSDVIIII